MTTQPADQDEEIRTVAGPRVGETRTITPDHSFITTSREWASHVLGQVAYAVEHGAWPQNMSMFDVARALRRAAGNAEYLQDELPDAVGDELREAALAEFVLGWYAADSQHGPVDKAEALNPSSDNARPPADPATDQSGPVHRMRHVDTDRLLWLANNGKWTDGQNAGVHEDLLALDYYPVS